MQRPFWGAWVLQDFFLRERWTWLQNPKSVRHSQFSPTRCSQQCKQRQLVNRICSYPGRKTARMRNQCPGWGLCGFSQTYFHGYFPSKHHNLHLQVWTLERGVLHWWSKCQSYLADRATDKSRVCWTALSETLLRYDWTSRCTRLSWWCSELHMDIYDTPCTLQLVALHQEKVIPDDLIAQPLQCTVKPLPSLR